MIGPQCLHKQVLLHKMRNMTYMLRTFLSHDDPARAKASFDPILKSIREVLNSWKGRDLTLTRKIQILKSLSIIPKFLSKATAIRIPKELKLC